MRRRSAAMLLATAAASVTVRAAAPVHRIGWLGFDSLSAAHRALFEKSLAGSGLVVGRNVELVQTDAGGDAAMLQARVAELLQQRVDIIVAEGSQTAAAAVRGAPKLPVVFYFVADAVRAGLVADLARPGGLVTGFGGHGASLQTKNLQLLRELLPALRTVAVVSNPEFPVHREMVAAATEAARALSIVTIAIPARGIDELPPALSSARQGGAQAVLLLPQPRLSGRGPDVARAMAASRLPAVSAVLEDARAGVLLAYGWRREDDLARVPEYVRRILLGTPAGELPVQQPSRFHLVVNRRTAQAMGITLPRGLLVQADEVVD